MARSTTTPVTEALPEGSCSSPSTRDTMSPCPNRWNGSSAPSANPRFEILFRAFLFFSRRGLRLRSRRPRRPPAAARAPPRGTSTRTTASRCRVPSCKPRSPNSAYPSFPRRSFGHASSRSSARAISSSSSSRSAFAYFSLCAVNPKRRVAREDPRWRVPGPRDRTRGVSRSRNARNSRRRRRRETAARLSRAGARTPSPRASSRPASPRARGAPPWPSPGPARRGPRGTGRRAGLRTACRWPRP